MSSRVLRRWKYHEDRCRTMRELSGELCDRQTGNRANKDEKKLVTMTQEAQRVSGKMLGEWGRGKQVLNNQFHLRRPKQVAIVYTDLLQTIH